jgi:hypothetical protein
VLGKFENLSKDLLSEVVALDDLIDGLEELSRKDLKSDDVVDFIGSYVSAKIESNPLYQEAVDALEEEEETKTTISSSSLAASGVIGVGSAALGASASSVIAPAASQVQAFDSILGSIDDGEDGSEYAD